MTRSTAPKALKTAPRTLKTVGVILLEPVAIFEFGVATEVFGLDRTADGVPPFEFRVCTPDPSKPLQTKTTTAVSITATHDLSGLIGCDLVIVSATLPRDGAAYPSEVLDSLRAAHRAGTTILSVCSGAFILGAAGLLDGRNCTTHWMYTDLFAEQFPTAIVDPRALFVDDGDIITSAGTAAGIDACLHVVRRELGTAVVTRIARRMVVPPQRDGGQQQFIQMPVPECTADAFAPLLSWMMENIAEDHSTRSLAKRVLMSERTFARRFAAETGTTPHKWLIGQRVLQARSLLGESDLTIEQIAERVGFNSAVVLREHFRRQIGLAPVDYRRRFVDPEREIAS